MTESSEPTNCYNAIIKYLAHLIRRARRRTWRYYINYRKNKKRREREQQKLQQLQEDALKGNLPDQQQETILMIEGNKKSKKEDHDPNHTKGNNGDDDAATGGASSTQVKETSEKAHQKSPSCLQRKQCKNPRHEKHRRRKQEMLQRRAVQALQDLAAEGKIRRLGQSMTRREEESGKEVSRKEGNNECSLLLPSSSVIDDKKSLHPRTPEQHTGKGYLLHPESSSSCLIVVQQEISEKELRKQAWQSLRTQLDNDHRHFDKEEEITGRHASVTQSSPSHTRQHLSHHKTEKEGMAILATTDEGSHSFPDSNNQRKQTTNLSSREQPASLARVSPDVLDEERGDDGHPLKQVDKDSSPSLIHRELRITSTSSTSSYHESQAGQQRDGISLERGHETTAFLGKQVIETLDKSVPLSSCRTSLDDGHDDRVSNATSLEQQEDDFSGSTRRESLALDSLITEEGAPKASPEKSQISDSSFGKQFIKKSNLKACSSDTSSIPFKHEELTTTPTILGHPSLSQHALPLKSPLKSPKQLVFDPRLHFSFDSRVNEDQSDSLLLESLKVRASSRSASPDTGSTNRHCSAPNVLVTKHYPSFESKSSPSESPAPFPSLLSPPSPAPLRPITAQQSQRGRPNRFVRKQSSPNPHEDNNSRSDLSSVGIQSLEFSEQVLKKERPTQKSGHQTDVKKTQSVGSLKEVPAKKGDNGMSKSDIMTPSFPKSTVEAAASRFLKHSKSQKSSRYRLHDKQSFRDRSAIRQGDSLSRTTSNSMSESEMIRQSQGSRSSSRKSFFQRVKDEMNKSSSSSSRKKRRRRRQRRKSSSFCEEDQCSSCTSCSTCSSSSSSRSRSDSRSSYSSSSDDDDDDDNQRKKKQDQDKDSISSIEVWKSSPSCIACYSGWFKFTLKLKILVHHSYFQRFIFLSILINAFAMGIEYHNQPIELTQAVEISNIFFTFVFALEMILKILGSGCYAYLTDGFNLFDAIVVMVSVMELFMDEEGSGLSVLRTFRLLRILKLVRFMPALKRQLMIMLKTLDNVAVFFALLVLFIFIFR